MKKLVLVTSFILAMGASLMAQNCATGYCPATITVHHKAGSVSPETVNITYEVVTTTLFDNTNKCVITRNLGATSVPSVISDATAASAGWYWQFNRSQGYSYATGSRVPNTTWVTAISESTDWSASNDPCTLLLGSTWRIPTSNEWLSARSNIPGTATTAAQWFSSVLHVHHAGYLADAAGGPRQAAGTNGFYAASGTVSNANCNDLSLSSAYTASNPKSWGRSVRCLRTY